MDCQAVGVIDKTKLFEFRHEMADARSWCTDHLRQMFLIDMAASGVFVICYAGFPAVIRTRPASRNMIVLFRRHMAAYIGP